MTNYDTAVALNRQVSNSNTHWHHAEVFEHRPELRREIASLLAYTVQDAEPAFVHAAFSDTNAADAEVVVAVFTDQTLVLVEGTTTATATIVPRSALQAVRVDQVPDLIGDSWPRGDALRVSLSYRPTFGSEVTVELGHTRQTPENARAMVDFLADLQGDLLR